MNLAWRDLESGTALLPRGRGGARAITGPTEVAELPTSHIDECFTLGSSGTAAFLPVSELHTYFLPTFGSVVGESSVGEQFSRLHQGLARTSEFASVLPSRFKVELVNAVARTAFESTLRPQLVEQSDFRRAPSSDLKRRKVLALLQGWLQEQGDAIAERDRLKLLVQELDKDRIGKRKLFSNK